MTAEPLRSHLSEAETKFLASPSLVQSDQSSSGTTSRPSLIKSPLQLTDELLLNFQRCKRRSFLDSYGDLGQRDSPSDYLLKLHQDSVSHQLSVLSENPAQEPAYPRRNWNAGGRATLELMQQGVERISRGVLQHTLENGVQLITSPKLLVKQPGYSVFGDWIYVPIDIKLGKRPKLDYQVIAAFQAYVLSEVQGAWSESSWLILRQRGAYEVDLVEQLPRMQQILDHCMEMLITAREPDVFIARNRCDLCHWLSHCYGVAQATQHLSLLPGVTPSRYVHLQELDLTTVESLAAISPNVLAPLPGFGIHVAHRIVRQAQSMLQNCALAAPLQRTDTIGPLLSPEELPTSDVELYFDIEAAPEQNLIYLHGILLVDRRANTETFYPLLAENPEDERLIWEQFLDLVWQYPHAPIFHFCPYEVQTVKRLANVYETPDSLIQPLIRRCIDLHERVTRTVALPIESYALKPIARWLGFNWRDSDANGAQSIYWYDRWLNTGDRTHLDAILRYNEDDCRATHHVKDWLVDFVTNKIC
ncbi:MAG TPA: TM0106 family RecB-like putative nuclease [Elainellaceae cyanobacterium]